MADPLSDRRLGLLTSAVIRAWRRLLAERRSYAKFQPLSLLTSSLLKGIMICSSEMFPKNPESKSLLNGYSPVSQSPCTSLHYSSYTSMHTRALGTTAFRPHLHFAHHSSAPGLCFVWYKISASLAILFLSVHKTISSPIYPSPRCSLL